MKANIDSHAWYKVYLSGFIYRAQKRFNYKINDFGGRPWDL